MPKKQYVNIRVVKVLSEYLTGRKKSHSERKDNVREVIEINHISN